MKTYIIIIAIALCTICFSCNQQQASDCTDIVMLIDKTDPIGLFPTASDITSQLGLDENPWQGVRLLASYISDTEINPTQTITLEKQSKWTGNITIRRNEIAHFKKQLTMALAKMKCNGSLQHSIVYQSISKQANWLAGSKADKRYLLVFSNLYENSEINFYDAQTIALLRNAPDTMQQRLERITALRALTGVQTWFLYNPIEYKDNNSYMVVATFYQHLFERHGATVHIDDKFLLL